MKRASLLKKLIAHHEKLEQQAGRVNVYSTAYEVASTAQGSFLVELPKLAQTLPWIQICLVGGGLQLPKEKYPVLNTQAEPLDEHLILGVIRGQPVDGLLSNLYEENMEMA